MERGMSDNQKELLSLFLNEWHGDNGIRVKTSGSTGTPKEITLSKQHIERSARRTNNFFNIKKQSRIHCAISFAYIGGKMMIARSLVSGCRLTFSQPSLNINLEDSESEVKLMAVVPAQMPYILANKQHFSNVETFLLGGSAIDDRLWDKITAAGLNAWESYGMTETASHIALRRISGPSNARPRFVPMKGIRIFSDFDDCLHIQDEDVTVATNDIVRIHKDNSFEILGRRDDIIVSGGIKIMPQEVESILAPYIRPFSKEFFISSVPDEIWTSKMILLCVPDGSLKSDFNEKSVVSKIQAAIDNIPTEILPKKKRPKEIRIIDQLPLTGTGKLKRKL